MEVFELLFITDSFSDEQNKKWKTENPENGIKPAYDLIKLVREYETLKY